MSANTEQYRESRANWTIADPGASGAIPVDRSGIVPLVTGSSAETRSLAAPTKAGIDLALAFDVDGGGNCVVTSATTINAAANTTMTFANAGDIATLLSVKKGTSFVWRLTWYDGASLG